VADSHGRISGVQQEGKTVGGYARLATLVAKTRAEHKDDTIVLIHAGDLFSRGDKLTRRTLGAANVELLNALGFSYWTPGNGEFYDGLANLRARLRQFRGKALTSNVHLAGEGKALGVETDVLQAGPVRVGFFGLCFVRKHTRKGLQITEAKATRKALRDLATAGADAVVAVTHIGLDRDLGLAASTGEIDVILGGHSHSTLPTGRLVPSIGGGKTLVAHAGDHLRYLGRVDLTFTRTAKGWKLSAASARLLPVTAEIQADPAIAGKIREMSRPGWKPNPPAVPAEMQGKAE
jgi:5'-nucleotidase